MGEGSGYETSLKDIHAVSTTASTGVHSYCGGWQCTYILYHVMNFENTSHHLACQLNYELQCIVISFLVECNYGTCDCTLTVMS